MIIEQDTICALSTPPGIGAVAMVRLSGPQALAITLTLVRDEADHHPAPRTAQLVYLQDEDGLVDEGLMTWFPAPNSYTGEEVVEIGLHGSTYIQQRMLSALVQKGARLARPGEFTQRAFLNRKLDLSQAEAVADVIASSSRAAHRLAQQQLKGGYSHEIAALRQKLVDLASLLELELDFSEEDVEFADRDQLRQTNKKITERVKELIDSFQLGNALKEGVPVAIIGAPNSGKSTLLNTLLGEQRAIVSDIPGTTRDSIEDTIQLDGILFRFIDTAGLRESEDVIESKGIKISKEKAKNAKVILYLYDLSMNDFSDAIAQMKELAAGKEEDQELLFIANKMDQAKDPTDIPTDHLAVSAMTGEGVDRLKRILVEVIQREGDVESNIILTNVRHLQTFKHVHEALRSVEKGMDQNISTDLLAAHMRQALYYLGEITGQVTTDELLGNIFGRFCIGK